MKVEAWVQVFARAAYDLPEVRAVYAGRFGSAVPSVTVVVDRHTRRAHARVMAVGRRDDVRAVQPPACCQMVGETEPAGARLIGRRP